MKNHFQPGHFKFQPGDYIGTNGTNIYEDRPRDGDMQGILLNMRPVILPEPWQNDSPQNNWRLTLYITKNHATSETFREVYAVNTVQTLQIVDLAKWSKL
jgi:hypothetical protein